MSLFPPGTFYANGEVYVRMRNRLPGTISKGARVELRPDGDLELLAKINPPCLYGITMETAHAGDEVDVLLVAMEIGLLKFEEDEDESKDKG